MEKLNLHLLVPNKNQNRFFGVDYFLDITTGYDKHFKYYSTPADPNPVFKDGPISLLPEKYQFLKEEISTKEKGSIIGIFANPDIYEAIDSIKPILDILLEYEMGLFIETSSKKILDDINSLIHFSKKQPLLVSLFTSLATSPSKLIDSERHIDKTAKIMQKLASSNIKTGISIKPIIPFINDSVNEFMKVIETAIDNNASFIYPTFSINFDSKKINDFYDIIDIDYPEIMIRLKDIYGYKHIWESENVPDLKKNYIIACRKFKVLYAMKDIINLYKPETNIQMRLF